MLLLMPLLRTLPLLLLQILLVPMLLPVLAVRAEEITPLQPIPAVQGNTSSATIVPPQDGGVISGTPEQQLLQQRLEQLYFDNQPATGEEPVYTAAYLLDLYRKNHFTPLWGNQDNIHQLISAIIASAEEGFIPDDYHLKAITRFSNEPREQLSLAQQVEADLLLSDAMLLLGHHKRFGKADPSKVDEKQNLETNTPRPQLADIFLGAIKTGTVRASLEQLSPHHQAYVALKEALKQYKQLAGQGGWPQVPMVSESLRPGMQDSRVPAIRRRLAVTGEYHPKGKEEGNNYSGAVVEAVKAFQARHHLEPDGVAGKTTIMAMNISATERIKQIRVNLERTRWVIHDMPSSNLIVDIAGFMLQYYHDNTPIWSSKVMVGKPYHQTPIFRSAITYIVLNPTWTPTPDIVKNETVPSIVKDPEFLAKQRLRVYDSSGSEVDSTTIPWGQYQGRHFPYTLRQDSGRDNALGLIKFLFPNPYHVYLHDTPSKSLFGRSQRAFSHGCIRVQNPLELGRLILAHDSGNATTPEKMDQIIASGKTTTVILKQPLPIYLMYLTANVKDGKVLFKPDLYDRDASIVAALNAPPSPLKLTTQVPEAKGQPGNQQVRIDKGLQLVQSQQPKEKSYAQDPL
jgi:murein L,D-transpeptidase YcbB/YkuD